MTRDDEERIEDLTSRVFRIVVENGKGGVLQSELWKELDVTSRDGSRIAIRLEKRSLINREKILENGRWTYKLIAIRLPVDTSCIEEAPCLTCPVEHMCSTEGTVSPNTCKLMEDWILEELSRNEQPSSNGGSMISNMNGGNSNLIAAPRKYAAARS